MVQLADGRIVSGSDDSTLRVWDSGSGACTLQLTGHTKVVNCVVQLADGRVASGSSDNALRVWDSGSGACILQLTGHTGRLPHHMSGDQNRLCRSLFVTCHRMPQKGD